MKQKWIYKSIILAVMLAVIGGSFAVFAQDELPIGSSMTVGSSVTVGQSNSVTNNTSKRIADLLAKAKPWDGQSITTKGVYAVTSDLTLTESVNIGQDAILVIPEEYTLAVTGGDLTIQGETVGMIVVSGGTVTNTGKADTIAVLDGNCTNKNRLENLMAGGGITSNQEQGKIQAAIVSGGQVDNQGLIKLITVNTDSTVVNQDGGVLTTASVTDGILQNNANGLVDGLEIIGGSVENQGLIETLQQSGGQLINHRELGKAFQLDGNLENHYTIDALTISAGSAQNLGEISELNQSGGNFVNNPNGNIALIRMSNGLFENNGLLDRLKLSGGIADNQQTGAIRQGELSDGKLYNRGNADEVAVSGGDLENSGIVTRLSLSGGIVSHSGELLKDAQVSGGELVNTGSVDSIQVSRQGVVINQNVTSIIKHVVIKNSGVFRNQGQALQITNSMGEPMYQIQILQDNAYGKATAEVDRRDVTGLYCTAGKKVKLLALPVQGMEFVDWSVGEGSSPAIKDITKSETTFIMPAENTTLIPQFSEGKGAGTSITPGSSDTDADLDLDSNSDIPEEETLEAIEDSDSPTAELPGETPQTIQA